MDLNKAIERVERYRDDIVTHGMTWEALSTVVEAARKQAEVDTMAKYPPIGASYHAYHRTAGITESLLCEVCRG
jgi:hypothetical protein